MKLLWKGLLAAATLHAGAAFALQPLPPQRPPQVWLDPSHAAEPVRLQDVAIDIRIQGFVASTQIDLTFFNPNARVLEGEFVLPLAEGQSITGYALEVEGRLREGVVVEKETARVAYETTVRRGIDPGFAELTQGNVFRTRLYPLPAHGTKRVRVAFDQPLVDAGKSYRYLLPLAFTAPLARFKVHAEAVRGDAPPAASGRGALSFERWQNRFVADLDRTDFLPERELAFDLPKPATPVTVFNLPDRGQPQWRRFAAQVQSAPPANLAPAAAPRRIALYYDASGSAATRERERELASSTPGSRGCATSRSTSSRSATSPTHRAASSCATATAASCAAIEALPLDGASAYGALRVDTSVKPDLVLVIGDGLSNFGSGEPVWQTDGFTPRLVFAHAAQTVDHARLTRWARRAGGQVLNLLALDDAAVIANLDRPRWALRATRVVRGECADLAPAAPQPAGATFSLYGRCSPDAELELRFGDGGGASLVRTIAPAAGEALDAVRGAFVERLWATARIADLDDAPQRDRDAIVALSKTHGVVTRDTSLLVLDRITDYVRYRVQPREPDLAAQYHALMASSSQIQTEAGARDQHRGRVLVDWQSFRTWHERPHAWLDTLLEPAAELEVVRWETAPQLSDDKAGQKLAREIAHEAATLRKRRAGGSAGQTAPAIWKRDAAALMLRLDTLRQRRLERAPTSDAITQPPVREERPARIGGGGARAKMTVQMAPPAMAPAPAATEAAAPARADDVHIAAQESARDADGGTPGSAELGIVLREWDPQTPYLARLRDAKDPYAAYLQERREQASTPAFFLDCANYFHNEAKDARLALRVLSNLAEIDFESAPLLRVLAARLQQWNRFDLAVPLFEQVLTLRGEEPQSRRDLALALSHRERPDFVRAVTLLWEVADRQWDARFPEVEIIALHELGDVLARAPTAQRPALDALTKRLGIPPALLEPLPVDLRVVLGWDADNVDIDLWVVDPLGDVAIFRNPRTKTGGHLSRDFTGGYGPEVFTIRRPIPGTYVVKTHYFSSRAQKLTGAVTLQLEFLTRFASGDSRREAATRRLDDVNGEIEIGRFTVGAE
ncbi:MAG TPA: VIT domain-containing protein [Tahibacter sp.]|uniref:VIT domain-containing protein n=1 Tax=Tahibacter sp. TaxID=2056211 RepID=UPI002C69AFBC|nr:VIT domain-containing protein [Tahibacter sp.]HSX61960.1 VIT domain-containing protein [Tahibacter sp.]